MVRLKKKPSAEEVRGIAASRIRTLMMLAEKVFLEDRNLAQRYADLAKAIGAKSKVRLPRALRRRICRYCGAYLWPGVNCRVRLRVNREPHIALTCLSCKRQMRIYYKRSRKRQTE
ncbi:MAG: ribonuclease P [Candidatus Freyarchaeota archaeon]|nr:ribonuclease P [Candidatus Jordarchaeia archaeon]